MVRTEHVCCPCPTYRKDVYCLVFLKLALSCNSLFTTETPKTTTTTSNDDATTPPSPTVDELSVGEYMACVFGMTSVVEEDDEWSCMVGLTLVCVCVFVHPPLLLIDGILPPIFSNDESVVEDTKDQVTVEESVGKTDGIVLAKSE